jgi:N-hydroxyarylamine O-acetyltransferase
MIFSARMNAFRFPVSAYLKRIGLADIPSPDQQGLASVVSGQTFSIPFENIDIHLGRSISLDPGALVGKMVNQPRGGYCHELNGILRLALQSLGFVIRPALARVLYNRIAPGAHTHQVLIVTLSNQEWLADAGFGGPGLRAPIPIIMNQVQEQYGERYRLMRDPQGGIVLQKQSHDSFMDLYSFNGNELTMDIDIEMSNHFTSTWPRSIFRLQRMCSLPRKSGRVTLLDMQLTIHRQGAAETRILPPGPQYMKALSEHFGIHVDATYEELAPLTR